MRPVLATVCLILCVLVGTGCSGSSNNARPQQAPLDWRGRKHVDVDAESNLFTPPEIVISPGTTVTWHNRDRITHNIRSAGGGLVDFGGPFGVEAGAFGAGAAYSFTFKKLGTSFFYTCTIHPGMNGHVRVATGTPATTVP